MPNIRVTCPTCKQELEVDARHAGQEVECGSCLQVFVARDPGAPPPAPSPGKKPYKARREPGEDEDEPRRESRPARRSRRDEDDYGDYEDDYDRPPRGGSADVPGIVGLVLGCVAVVCLLLGCFTCGITYVLAVPLALIGTGFSLFGRGGLRVAGLLLNVLALLPAIVVLVLWAAGAAGALIPRPIV